MRPNRGWLIGLKYFRDHFRSKIGYARCVAAVGDAEGQGVLHPVVPDAVGVVRRGGDGVFLWAELASESKGDTDGLARLDGADGVSLKLGVGAVYFGADAGADHHADDGIFDIVIESHSDAHRQSLAALDNQSGTAVGAEGFDGDDFGAAVASAEGRGERGGHLLAPGAELGGDVLLVGVGHFAGVAFGMETAVVDPPDLVGDLMEQFEVVGGDENGGAGLAKPFNASDGAGANECVCVRQSVVEYESGNGGKLEWVEGAEIAGWGVEMDFSGLGGVEAGGEAEELPRATGIFADDADESAVGSGDGKLLYWGVRRFAEMNGHR